MNLHHVGVAVTALAPAIAVHETVFGLHLVAGPFEDPLQKVAVCFLAGPTVVAEPDGAVPRGPRESLIELCAPLGDASPLAGFLKKQIGAYHVCYEVDDLDASLAHARAHACVLVSGPTPAVAFAGRRIAWFVTPTRQLTELVERARSTSPTDALDAPTG